MNKLITLLVIVMSLYIISSDISFANNTNTNFQNEVYSKLNSQVGKSISNNPITDKNIEFLCKCYIQNNCSEIDTANLKLIAAFNKVNQWFVHFAQTYKGIELTDGRIKIRLFQDGKLLDIEPNIYKNVSVELVSNIDSNQMKLAAISVLEDQYNINTFNFEFEGKKIFSLNGGKTFREVEAIKFSNKIHTISYGMYVDCQTNEVLFKKNLVMNYFTAKAMIYETPFVPMVENTKFPYLKAVVQGKSIFANSNGIFTSPTNIKGSTATIDFSNYTSTPDKDTAERKRPYCLMEIYDYFPEKEYTLEWDEAYIPYYINLEFIVNANSEILLTSEDKREDSIYTFMATHYFHLFKMNDAFKKVDSEFDYLSRGFGFSFLIYNTQDPNYINYSNASSNGHGITFYNIFVKDKPFVLSSGTLYHELGHSINFFIYKDCGGYWGMNNMALHEGTADVHAAFVRNDPEMDFMSDRTLENTFKLGVNEKGESHADGRIFSGAMWDLKKLTSLELMGHLLHYTRFAIPDGDSCKEAYSNWLKEMLITDDNDGSLANLTPHFEEIIESFDKHNITLALYSQINFKHTPLNDTKNTVNAYQLELTIPFVNQFVSKRFDSVWVCYSVNYVQQKPVLLIRQNDRYYGSIPAQPKGSLVQYYFDAFDPYRETHYYLSQYNGLYSFLVNFDTAYKNTGKQAPLKNTSENALVWKNGNPIDQSDTIKAFAPTSEFGDNSCWMLTDHPKQTNHLKSATIIFPNIKMSSKKVSIIQLYYFFYYITYSASCTLDFSITRNGGSAWLVVSSFGSKDITNDWQKLHIDIRNRYSTFDSIGIRVRAMDRNDYVNNWVRFAAYLDNIAFLTGEELTSIKENALANSMLSPNPTNNFSMISFNSLVDGNIKIVLTNILGEQVKTIYDGYVEAGDVSIAVDVSKLNSGIYFINIIQGTNTTTQKLVVN
jgi:hypothetical protein